MAKYDDLINLRHKHGNERQDIKRLVLQIKGIGKVGADTFLDPCSVLRRLLGREA